MPLVTVKKKFQVVIPQAVREALNIGEGDILEAQVEDGRLIYTPKQVIDRGAAFERMAAIAERAEAKWRAEGISDEEMEAMIVEEVRAVRKERAERTARGAKRP